jgi:DNA-binding NarL/FixJ family response regulator
MIRRVIADLAEPIYDCPDGADAADLCVRHRPDCVLMDIEMPLTDGIAATRQVLALAPGVRVVTQYDDRRMRAAARQAGACAYVLKENLLDVRRLLETWV